MPDPPALAAELAERVDALIARELTKLKSPAVRAQVAHDLGERLNGTAATIRALRGDAIRTMRRGGVQWATIADLLDVTPQRAQQLAAPQLSEVSE